MESFNLKGFKEFIDIEERRKKLETELKEVKAEKAELEAVLIEQFENSDLDNKISIAGKTIYVKTTISATISDKRAAIEILKKTGYDYVVKEDFNARSLGALVREIIEENGEELPAEFGDVIKPFYRSSLGMRAA